MVLPMAHLVFLALLLVFGAPCSCNDSLPIVINTWPFVDANIGGWLKGGGGAWRGCVVCVFDHTLHNAQPLQH